MHKNYNKFHNYPIFIHYFDDIYDSQGYRDTVNELGGGNVEFINIPYSTPNHINEADLYYNRKDIKYVRDGFSINRKGYLHMCHFMSNFYGYPETKFEEFDMAMSVDDESTFTKEMDYDPFEIMKNREEHIGALICGQRLKNGSPHQGHRDTRVGLWEFTKNFLIENNIKPKNEILKEALNSKNGEEKMHYFPWADSYIIKLEIFESEIWKKWSKAFNDYGGIYKYRWGDNEINSLFALMIEENGIYNLKTVEDGYHNQGGSRHIQDVAPSIKNTEI